MAITKKIIIPIIIVLLIFMPMVSACNEVPAEQQQTTIIEKYEREEYETFRSWFWDKPVYEKHYYFLLQFEDGEIIEKDVGSKTYYSYQVGDTYLV
jgi:hypothetical protein